MFARQGETCSASSFMVQCFQGFVSSRKPPFCMKAIANMCAAARGPARRLAGVGALSKISCCRHAQHHVAEVVEREVVLRTYACNRTVSLCDVPRNIDFSETVLRFLCVVFVPLMFRTAPESVGLQTLANTIHKSEDRTGWCDRIHRNCQSAT